MKKHFLRSTLCVLLACTLAIAAVFPAFAGTPAEDAHLHFNADGRFRILNFSDIQDDESLDSRVKDFIPRAVYNACPDLIVLTGDNIYGSSVGSGMTDAAIAQYMDIFQSLGVPVAIVFGNHDDNGNALSKEEQMEIYNRYGVSISYDEGSSMSGCGTYNVPIYGSTETDKVKFNLWMFDTGSSINNSISGKYDYMRPNQLNWYKAKSNELKAANGGVCVPSIAFQHIIVNDIYKALKQVSSGTSGAVKYNSKYYVLPDTAVPGSIMREHPCPSDNSNETEFSVLKQQGDVIAIVSGHDHRNMFIVPYQGIDLINTPAAGYYANIVYHGDDDTRGARIIDIDEQTGSYTTEMLFLRDLVGKSEYYSAQSGVTKYVKNIALCVAQSAQYGSIDAAKTAACNRLYTAVDASNGNGVVLWNDLNGGATLEKSTGNHYVVCMGYTITTSADEAMRGLGLCFTGSADASGSPYNGSSVNGLTWNLCNANALAVSGTDGAVDLNAGTGGTAMYFMANYGSSGSPLTDIQIVNTGEFYPIDMSEHADYQLAEAVVGNASGSDYADLNKTAWGDYVYALYRTASAGQTRVPLNTLPLREAVFRANMQLLLPGKTYSEESLTALTSALAQAETILHDIENDGQTTVYDQLALNTAASRIIFCTQQLDSAYTFRLSFDPNGGTCTEQSRMIHFGAACGTLPDAQREGYIFDGWFTQREGGKQKITANTVFAGTNNRTVYAHWTKEPEWITVTFDANGGVCTEESRRIISGTACGTLPAVKRDRYRPDGWFTEREGGEQVTAETVFTGTDDRTLFAHWTKDPSLHMPGDANGDDGVNMRDIVVLQRYLAGGWNVQIELDNADVNADGKVNLLDVMLLRRYLAGGWGVELV